MLKIRDDIDLKQLEKFGFKKRYSNYIKDCVEDDTYPIRIDIACGKMAIKNGNYGVIYGIYYYTNEIALATLFDLIQAGLVEKVEDNND